MFNHSLTVKRIFLNACLMTIAGLVLSNGLPVAAQEPDYASERKRAYQLLEESKIIEALPVFEKLAAQNPKDGDVLFMLGFCIVARTREIKDPAAVKSERARARGYLVRAKELGVTEPLLHQLIAAIPPDGGEVSPSRFSSNAEADKAMNEGESAFAHGELDKAFNAYARALQLDPKLYEAALWAGDMKFKKGFNSTDAGERSALFDQAGEWFTKAIAINPNRETAYRYWGNTLLAYGKDDQALPKYIEAIVAEPYNQLAYTGLTKWGQKNKVPLGHPRIDIPTNVGLSEKGNVTITLDPKTNQEDGSSAWTLYGMKRALWMTTKFKEKFPNEKEYRHSLDEESDALRGVAEQAKWLLKNQKAKQLDASLANLIKLHDAGLIEAYVLFARHSKGIPQDYDAYRKANRDKLMRYWSEVVIEQ